MLKGRIAAHRRKRQVTVTKEDATDASALRQQAARDAQKRLVRHLANGGTTDLAPDCLYQPAGFYTSAQQDAQERRAIFGEWPLIAGLSQDLSAPGDLLLFEELGHSVILSRDKDGRVHAVLNMCAHRGARLIDRAAHGTRLRRSRLACPFHGWCYTLDGRLIAAPGAEGFDPDLRSNRRLISLPVTEWNGLLLLSLNPQADTATLAQRFAPVDELLRALEMGMLTHVHTSSIEARCNWKLAVDTYAENYHFGVLHGASLGDAYISNVTAFDDFAPHWRAYFPETALLELLDLNEQDWPEPVYRAILFLFPNTILVVGTLGEGRTLLRMYRMFPGADAGHCLCRMSVYAAASPEDMPQGLFANEAESPVTQEDYAVAESIQANLENAPADQTLVYGRNEIGVQYFHAALAAALAGGGLGRRATSPPD